MRSHAKVKVAAGRTLPRKTATSASAAARRSFPAWIDAADTAVVFSAARRATPRVRVGLVLRRVNQSQTIERRVPHGSSSR
jgi:hypothetical protein